MAGCQDRETAIDLPANGLFTAALKRVWANGQFSGNCAEFIRRIKMSMPSYQTPNLLAMGPRGGQLELERPFF
jgi:hypothetical protein